MTTAARSKSVRDDVDLATSRWRSYSFDKGDFHKRAAPQSTYRGFVSSTFQPVQRMWRSASSSTLSFETDMQMNMGRLRRSSSYSSLAPSNALSYRERSVERYIPKFTSYTPKSDNWRKETSTYQQSYSFCREVRKSSYRPSVHVPPKQFETYPRLRSSFADVHRSSIADVPKYRSSFEPPKGTWQYITRPTTLTRWQYSAQYNSARLSGLNTVSSFLFRNYELDDDRRMHRLHWGARSMDSPYKLRRFFGSWYLHRPSRILHVY